MSRGLGYVYKRQRFILSFFFFFFDPDSFIKCEQLLPLLSAEQKRKHVEFATDLRNFWGDGPDPKAKILWIHYDEKWFYGFHKNMQSYVKV